MDEELDLLCPFVDLYSQGDKVSIVDIENVKDPQWIRFAKKIY